MVRNTDMGWLCLLYPIIYLHFLLFHFPSYSSSLAPLCNSEQSSALLQFKNSFSLDSSASRSCEQHQSSYPKTTSWENGTNCCIWDGVTCDATWGHVIGLDLSCSWLVGKIHPNSTIFQLAHLKRLNLAFNNFNNSPIYSEFGRFMNLTHLNLSSSAFNGEIPPKISELSKLMSLHLSFGLTLEPFVWKRLMQNLTNLQELFLDGVNMFLISPNSLSLLMNLSSSLVSLSFENTGLQGYLTNSILTLPNLQKLCLSGNWNLRGKLPESNWSTHLRYLDFSFANFSGDIPSSLINLQHLTYLNLSYNSFGGQIPNVFNQHNKLQALGLSGNNLGGQLPDSIGYLKSLDYLDLSGNNLGGQLLDSIGYLKSLNYIDLSRNNLGGQLPDSIGYLKSLSHLDLSSCEFKGPIPLSFWNLTLLTFLSLGSNNLTGEISSSISNIQYLTFLDISNNSFSGQIPNVFNQFRKLIFFSISKNKFGGKLPLSLFRLAQISELQFSNNRFSGSIPVKISGLPNLIKLDLGNNLLNGTIPAWVFSSLSLSTLDLSDNQLTGHVGELSSHSLQQLYLSNNMLQGSIPKSMFDLENLTDLSLSSNNLSGVVDFHRFSNLRKLRLLDLSSNKFLSFSSDYNIDYIIPNLSYVNLSSCNIISFPKFLRCLQNFTVLDISNNKIQGMVPKWFNSVGNKSLLYLDLSNNLITSVEHLSTSTIFILDVSFNLLQGDFPILPLGILSFSISNNNLAGNISSTICNAKSLWMLNLSHNNLTGPIPQCLASFPYLLVLDLKMNKLSGTMLGNFSKGNVLQALTVHGNQLEGPLPQSLANCTQLQILDLGNNNIDDVFPHWLQTFSELQVLSLRGNKFHGAISTNFKTKHPFPKLRIFDVSNNYFRGTLPASYIKEFKGMVNIDGGTTGLKYMKDKNFSPDVYSVTITLKGNVIEMSRILITFTTIDFSNNEFEGKIPEVIGELRSLKGLNLSHNKINGSIPMSFGKLINLEWLDLSWNQLEGEIPVTLTNLNSLSILNLSQNQLVGSIPQGKQFNTFLNDSYGGNLDLCGFPLSKTCKKDEAEQPPSSSTFNHKEEFGFTWKPVVIGYGCGVPFGIFMGYIVFLIQKPLWLVRMVEGEPKKKVKRARNRTQPNRRRIN